MSLLAPNREQRMVYGMAVVFFAYGLLHLGYGLPLHLIGDEESLIGGTLKILQLHTLPVLRPAEFSILYYSVLLPVIYIIGLVPYLCWAYFFAPGVGSLQELSQFVLVHLDQVWIIARFFSVAAGAALIPVTYRLAENFFPKERLLPLFAAVLMATSFLHFQLSIVARHWVFSTFFFALSLVFVTRNKPAQKRDMRFAGLFAGLAAGIGPLGFVTIVFDMLVYMLVNRIWPKDALREPSVRHFLIVSLVLGIFFVLLHPGAYFFIAAGEETPSAAVKNLSYIIVQLGASLYYLFEHEFVLTMAAFAGFMMLVIRKQWQTLLPLGATVVIYSFLLMFLFHNAPRYHLYTLPLMTVAAAYALSRLHTFVYPKHWLAALLIMGTVFALPGLAVLRYSQLTLTPSTEQLAAAWLRSHSSPDTAFVLNAPLISFIHDEPSAVFQSAIGRVPLVSRSLSGVDIVPYGGSNMRYVNIHFWESENPRPALKAFIASEHPRYALMSYDNSGSFDDDSSRYLQSLTAPVISFDNGATTDISAPVQPFDEYGILNYRLFTINRFGSYVSIRQF